MPNGKQSYLTSFHSFHTTREGKRAGVDGSIIFSSYPQVGRGYPAFLLFTPHFLLFTSPEDGFPIPNVGNDRN
jgi:hypothetical protein